jgi:hypothetical protein
MVIYKRGEVFRSNTIAAASRFAKAVTQLAFNLYHAWTASPMTNWPGISDYTMRQPARDSQGCRHAIPSAPAIFHRTANCESQGCLG